MMQELSTQVVLEVGEPMSDDPYRAEVAQCPRLVHCPKARRQELFERARSGDAQAREEIILLLLHSVRFFALRYFAAHCVKVTQFDYLDLVQVGSLEMLEKLDAALATDHPFQYLLTAAYGEIRTHGMRYKSAITAPEALLEQPYPVLSLSQPLRSESAKTLADVLVISEPSSAPSSRNHASLYQAVESLPDKQKTTVIRYYGLYESGAETLKEISTDMFGETAHKRTCGFHTAAINNLYIKLAPAYPQYRRDASETESERPQEHPSITVFIPEDRMKRLDEAYERLEAKGQKFNSRDLAYAAKMSPSWACAYLKQRPNRVSRFDQAHQRVKQVYATLLASGQEISINLLCREAGIHHYYAKKFLAQQEQQAMQEQSA